MIRWASKTVKEKIDTQSLGLGRRAAIASYVSSILQLVSPVLPVLPQKCKWCGWFSLRCDGSQNESKESLWSILAQLRVICKRAAAHGLTKDHEMPATSKARNSGKQIRMRRKLQVHLIQNWGTHGAGNFKASKIDGNNSGIVFKFSQLSAWTIPP